MTMRLKSIVIGLMCLALAGCTTQREAIYRSSTDTVYVRNVQVDSIYVMRDRFTKGDTVFLKDYEYRYRMLRDTVYQSRTDTAVSERVVTQTRWKRSGWDRFTTGWFVGSLVLALCMAAVWAVRKFYLRV